jgi:putative transposase
MASKRYLLNAIRKSNPRMTSKKSIPATVISTWILYPRSASNPQRSLNPLPSTGRICSKTMSENTVAPSILSSPVRASRSLSSTDASTAMPLLTTSTTTMAKDGPKFAAKYVAIFFQTQKRHHPSRKAKYFCPHCHKALYRWKEQPLLTIYKCGNDHCPAFLTAINKLNASEKQLQKKNLSQFKLRYQYREYHFQPSSLKHSAPDKPKINLDRIHHRSDILGLVLAFHISCAITARKTAFILRNVFNVPISYQTVLNYAESAAYHCHLFNLQRKGPIDPISSADETYIKIRGKHHFVFFFISTKSLKITAYHLADNREVLPATIAMTEAIHTALPDQKLTVITDGNPSYTAAIHFLNAIRDPLPPLTHHKVIGLQNLDEESTEFRFYKQIIERLNRTYKSHVRPTHGFNVRNGAMALTTLFVTHYNFLRPHMTLNYNVPIPLPELDSITSLQGKWMKILSMATPSVS